MNKNTVIIGGGIAGLQCAWELSKLGIESAIIESAPQLGGHAAGFCCKAGDKCRRCGACLTDEILRLVAGSCKISTFLETRLRGARKMSDGFRIELLRQPEAISSNLCTACGKCIASCPVSGAIVHSGDAMMLRRDRCLHFKGEQCAKCVDACPERAVNLSVPPESFEMDASAVVIAAGFSPFDASEKARFGYGRVPGVITALEAERLLRNGNSLLEQAEKVGFIQCVGSRDPKIGRNYCSRVCCGYGLRTAQLIKDKKNNAEISMFYMDMQTYDRDFERRLEQAAKVVKLVRAIPSEVRVSHQGKPEVVYFGREDRKISEEFDLLILSIGISPSKDVNVFRKLFDLEVNRDGFLGLDYENTGTNTAGVFVAGAVQGPRSISESVSHAIRAAYEVGAYLTQIGESR